jgi:hypothetical protein
LEVKKRKKLSGICIFPRYKWCGPNCSGPGAPINDVDACCKAHDECLKFDSHCKCDREFMNCLRPKMNATTKKGRDAALMYYYMKIQTIFTCRFNN